MNDPFDFPEVTWLPLDERYIKVQRISSAIWNSVFTMVGAAALWFWLDWWWAVSFAVVWLLWTGFVIWRHGRRTRAWGYAERGEDFCIKNGIWRRILTVIPYGRIQTVSVSDGPILRHYDLAGIAISTAAAGGGSDLTGLTKAAAETLRDRLIEKAEERKAGL